MNAEDYATDQAMDAAVQMQAEFEGRARRVCSWHEKHFPGQPNLIEDGGSGKTSHGMCCNCTAIENAEADRLLARARAEARYSEFESYLEDEGRVNPYSGIDEWTEAV